MNKYKLVTSKPIRLFECFSGIGTQAMAFDRLGLDYEVVGISEIDKFALLSYASIHTDYLKIRETYFEDKQLSKEYMIDVLQSKNVGYDFKKDKHSIYSRTGIETVKDYYLADLLTKNYGDISLIKGSDLPKDIDMLTYSFPCTNLSSAGKQAGLVGTRSGLVYEVFRILIELEHINNKPKALIMENVIALIQKKFIKDFENMQGDLVKLGYTNSVMRMNARDYGVAQRRDRVFMVSTITNEYVETPKPFELELKLGDYLESEVDEKYTLSEKGLVYILGNAYNKDLKDVMDRSKMLLNKNIAYTLNTNPNRRVGDTNYITNARKGEITVKEFIKIMNEEHIYARKLTPKECWRLMGIDDSNFEKAERVVSNTQLYKQAGNAIVVDVFAAILKEML